LVLLHGGVTAAVASLLQAWLPHTALLLRPMPLPLGGAFADAAEALRPVPVVGAALAPGFADKLAVGALVGALVLAVVVWSLVSKGAAWGRRWVSRPHFVYHDCVTAPPRPGAYWASDHVTSDVGASPRASPVVSAAERGEATDADGEGAAPTGRWGVPKEKGR
jgi:hypothetical protein